MPQNNTNLFRAATRAIGPCIDAIKTTEDWRRRFTETEREQVKWMLDTCCDLFETLHAWMRWDYRLNDRAALTYHLDRRLCLKPGADTRHLPPCRAAVFAAGVEAMCAARGRLRAAGRGLERPLSHRENIAADQMVRAVAEMFDVIDGCGGYVEMAEEMRGIIGEGGVPLSPHVTEPQAEW
ncbi:MULTISPECIES: hypothetical protein [unclassified Lysobacter]|uniref:hypothetical protein n=1 Tax=unclassified Lysobacter TaxID=2635362 RepID=UPI001BE87A91|nr:MULTISPECIES: hypothetical protein [unclassified Lysobacter]MBT2748359.1 hypothetical protein [Lysobacter sp. ISL-42]MBT2749874.1 hypothetical protein [Lysobacter sp. ISL-50]MBT2781202.1 hypothetical protein [Lysobacter sp. ISL-52]